MTILRICFVGDSITVGTGDDDFLSWPGRLCQRECKKGHDLALYNLGIRGDTSDMVRARWRAECEARTPPDVAVALVFAFGINDACEDVGNGTGLRVPLAKSLANARAVLEPAKAWLPTLWIGPTPVDEAKMPLRPRPSINYHFRNSVIGEYNAAFGALARELGVPYLDLFSVFKDKSPFAADLTKGDGVHPLRDGYALMADAVERWPAWRAWLDR